VLPCGTSSNWIEQDVAEGVAVRGIVSVAVDVRVLVGMDPVAVGAGVT
jgi:hypothetical protein